VLAVSQHATLPVAFSANDADLMHCSSCYEIQNLQGAKPVAFNQGRGPGNMAKNEIPRAGKNCSSVQFLAGHIQIPP
jgi:hypothetical protein